jgi:hypothetical protein
MMPILHVNAAARGTTPSRRPNDSRYSASSSDSASERLFELSSRRHRNPLSSHQAGASARQIYGRRGAARRLSACSCDQHEELHRLAHRDELAHRAADPANRGNSPSWHSIGSEARCDAVHGGCSRGRSNDATPERCAPCTTIIVVRSKRSLPPRLP